MADTPLYLIMFNFYPFVPLMRQKNSNFAARMTGSNTRIARNTLFLYIRMFFVLAVSLYTSRVILRTLGVSDYGVYNVVAGFVSMFGFLNVTLAASMQRFYNYEGTSDAQRGYRRVYATGLTIHLAIAFVLLVLMETLGWWYVNNVMVVPPERLLAANVAYQMAVGSLLLVVLEIPYTASILARERFDFYALVGILEVTLRLLAVIALPWLPYDKVIALATLTITISAVRFLMFFVYAKRKTLPAGKGVYTAETDSNDSIPQQGESPSLLRQMLSFSGWNVLGTFSQVLKGQGVNMLLNVFFGTVVNAARAVAFQVNAAITGFSNNVAMSFQAQIVNSYAAREHSRLMNLFYAESRICFVLIAFLITPLVLEMDFVLSLWLGDSVPPQTRIFTILVLIDSLVCTLEMPCTQVAYAVGRIRDYKVVPAVISLLLLPTAWVGLKMGMSAVSVFTMTIVFSVLQVTASMTMLHRIFTYSVTEYLRRVLLPCFLFLCLNVVAPLMVCRLMDSSWLRLVAVCIAEGIAGLLLAYFLVLGKSEKELLLNYLRKLRR